MLCANSNEFRVPARNIMILLPKFIYYFMFQAVSMVFDTTHESDDYTDSIQPNLAMHQACIYTKLFSSSQKKNFFSLIFRACLHL